MPVLNFGAVKEAILPEWTKPENASVFDPVYRAPVRTLISMLGLDDPQQVMGLGVPLETGPMGGGAIEAISKRFPRFADALKATHIQSVGVESAPATTTIVNPEDPMELIRRKILDESGGKLSVLDLRRKPSGDVELETIAVAPHGSGQGVGTKAMQSLTDWADSEGVRLILSPSERGYQPVEGGPKTTSTSRLIDFYKDHGFVSASRGRGYDPTLSSPTRPVLYRNPRAQKGRQ